MQLSTIATALLLPLLAVAQPPPGAPVPTSEPLTTVTRTTSQTLTKTIYLTRTGTETIAANGTSFTSAPSGRPGSTTVGIPPKVTNAGSVMGGTHIAVAAFAGVAVAVLL